MKIKTLLSTLIFAFGALSCADNLSVQENRNAVNEEGCLLAELAGYDNDTDTKVAFPNGLSDFKWSNGDCIGVCRSGATANGTAAFTLLKGGDKVGNFVNDAFSLNPETEYFAFFPFAVSATTTTFPISVTGQVQEGPKGLSHVGKYNYMVSQFKTDANNGANFTFRNICAVIQVHFTSDSEATYTHMTVTSDNDKFFTKASYNLAAGAFLPTAQLSSVALSFGEGLHVYNGEDITLSLVVIPADLSKSNLTFEISDRDGVAKEFTLAGYAFSSGKLYHFYEEDSLGNPPYGGCPDGDHPHMVDLGLPSGTLWACCDVGSSVPTEKGIPFAWGETDPVEKNTSNWSNYAFMNETINDWMGITKYQTEDKQYAGCWYAADSTFVGDGLTTLEMIDDAARQNWGENWRMPTKEDAEELDNYTTKEWTSNYNGKGVSGYIYFKKKLNGKYSLWDTHIFIPCDRRYAEYYETYAEVRWTSSLRPDNSTIAWRLVLHDRYSHDRGDSRDGRCTKNSIRPVCSKKAAK